MKEQVITKIPEEVLKKVKLLELKTRKLVNNLFAGEYHTAFKGQGMTFSDFREYVPGDDVRNISWALTARAGKPYIKKFDEERELTVILAVDVSGSNDFGSGQYLKGEMIVHLAALLAFAAIKNKDQVGLLLFSDQVEHYVPPGKSRGHVQRILRDLFYVKPQRNKTSIRAACDHLQAIQKKKAAIFMLSDFIDEDYDRSLRMLGKKHDVTAIVLRDPLEQKLPELGLVDWLDPETGETFLVDTSSKEFQKQFQKIVHFENEERQKVLSKSQVEKIEISTNSDYVGPLISFFRRRASGAAGRAAASRAGGIA